MRRRTFLSGLLLASVVVLGLGACGTADDAASPSPAASSSSSTSSSPSSSPSSEPTTSDPAVPGDGFTLATADGTVEVTGPASSCVNPDEGTLDLVFADDATTVTVTLALGTGTVSAEGDHSFEGTITDFVISDSGDVRLSGTGAETTFTVTGTCTGR